MGLDVYLTTYNKTEYERAQSHNNVGDQISCPARENHSFHKFNALANWVDDHVDSVQPLKPVLLSQENIKDLKDTLDNLNDRNCKQSFPADKRFTYGMEDYGEFYWDLTDRLKNVVTALLINVNWDTEVVEFVIY